MRLFGLSWAVAISGVCVGATWAEEPAASQRPYDGIQAGLDAFRLSEEKRQSANANQLFLNDQMRYLSGLPTSRGATIYYGYGTPVLPPANLHYTYAYGGQRYWGAVRRQTGLAPQTVFEPWPVVPGDIYGYVYVPPLRQPIGQRQEQTGPNRWESHPVYDPPLADYRPLPPVDSPLLEKPPTPAPRRGPREY